GGTGCGRDPRNRPLQCWMNETHPPPFSYDFRARSMHEAGYCIDQIRHPEGLAKVRPLCIIARQTGGPVTSDKREWDVAIRQRFSHWIDTVAPQVDAEDRGIVGPSAGCLERFPNSRDRP